jgi:hypothetical protein
MINFKAVLYPFFFLIVVLLSFGLLLGLFFLYHFVFERYGEIIVVLASVVTFIWLANMVENARFYHAIKKWFLR